MRTSTGVAWVRCRTTDGASILSYRGSALSWAGPEYDGLKGVTTIYYESGTEAPGRYTYLCKDEPWIDAVVFPGRYSQLEIAFQLESQEVLEDQAQYPALLHWIESIAQNFVGLYAGVTGEIDIVQPRIEDLDETRIFIADDYDLSGGMIRAEFSTVRMHGPPPRHAALRYRKVQMDQEKINQFTEYVSKGYVLSPSQQLIQRAKEQAHIYRNFDLCILIIGAAFEVGVRELLRSVCTTKGVRVLTRKVGRGKKSQTLNVGYEDAIARGDLKVDLLEYINQLGGTNGRGGREYNAWEEFSYKVRNSIVHQGRHGYGDEDAEKAFTAAVAYLEFLRSHLV